MIPIAGIQRFTTVDFPGALSCVFFTQGCPWRCRYCHNSDLQKFSSSSLDESWNAALQFLHTRKDCLEAVVVSGGEATAHAALPLALAQIRQLKFKTGLHTAGIYPERLKATLPLLDWVGFDLKAPLDHRYDQITQIKNSAEAVKKSLLYVLQSGVSVQLRCTFHPLLLNDEALETMRNELSGLGFSTPLVLQKFQSQGCQDSELNEFSPLSVSL